MTEKGKTVQIAGEKSSLPAKITLQPQCIVISDECWREIAEAEHPGMQVIGPRDMRPGAVCLADVFAEEPQVFEGGGVVIQWGAAHREHGMLSGMQIWREQHSGCPADAVAFARRPDEKPLDALDRHAAAVPRPRALKLTDYEERDLREQLIADCGGLFMSHEEMLRQVVP